ncbi:MAG: peptidoglycan recognition family protein [Candidatus Parcubacteria bacterium]|nr:peptidoglycan recognition family protein [Candidatus Parcubacteria bacterium]
MNLSKSKFPWLAPFLGAALLVFFLLRPLISYSPEPEKIIGNEIQTNYKRSYPNLIDFENNYGQPLNSDTSITIISREEWQAPINYSREDYYTRYCESQADKCFNENQNDFDSDLTYLKLKNNYDANFKFIDEGLLKTKTINDNVYEYMPVNQIVIHHTAHSYFQSYANSINELNRIYYAHAILNGWRDIGYNYLIDNDGNIFEGRGGDKYVVGSHAGYHNRGSLGIALMADLTKEPLSKEMQASLIELVGYLSREYSLNLSQADWLPSADNAALILDTKIIKGHQELDARGGKTQCPGISSDTLREIIYEGLGLKQPAL